MPPPSAGAAAWRTRRCGALGSLPTCSYRPDRDSSGGSAWSPRYLRPSCVKESSCMPHDAELVAETKAWFDRAHADIRAADHEWSADPPLVEDIVFHAQQAVEKSFKAFLAWHGVTFRKTHNLEELAESCLRIDPTLKALADKAVPLTELCLEVPLSGRTGVAFAGGGCGGLGNRQGGLRGAARSPAWRGSTVTGSESHLAVVGRVRAGT